MSREGDLLRLACEMLGHSPKDIDPTGGDPFMGGPVLITICARCGTELPHSDSAKAFNEWAGEERKRKEREEQDRAKAKAEAQVKWHSRKNWWRFGRG